MLMGGGYTFVLERRRRDAEDATRRAEDAARERALYFEDVPEDEPEEEDDVDGRVGTGKENMDGVGAALKGWGTGSNQTRARGRGVDEESVLPPPRYGSVAPSAASGSRTASEPATTAASGVDAMGESAYPTSTRGSRQSLASSTRSGYGSQLAMVSHVGGSSVPPPPRPRTRSIIF